MERIDESEGQSLFGLNVLEYDQTRPAYPKSFYLLLTEQGALNPGTVTLEIGSGSGTATRHLIQSGANPITLIEPDARFRGMLQSLSEPQLDLQLLTCRFEDAELPANSFELIVAATAFHWLDPATRVKRLAGLVRQGGHVALIWNVFQNAEKDDEFHEATKRLLEQLPASPSSGTDSLPFALDRTARESEFCGRGLFERTVYAEIFWSLELDASQVRSLYQGFSSIARLPDPERKRILDQIHGIAVHEFNGRVIRHMTTPIYLFRRSDSQQLPLKLEQPQ